MKKTLKQMLVLAVIILCMLALFTVTTSASATYADDNAAIAGGAVARIGEEGSGTYYDSVDAAIEAVPFDVSEPTVITLIADATFDSAITLEYKALTIQGANNNVVLTLQGWEYKVRSYTSLTFDGLKISVVEKNTISNNVFILEGSAIKMRFKNCAINTNIDVNSNFIRVLGVDANLESLEFSNVTFSGGKFDFIAIGAGGETCFGSADNPIVFENLVGNFGYMIYNKNGMNATIHLNVTGSTITGTIDEFAGTVACDDAAAKLFGYKYRIGDVALGKLDDVYFATKDEALQFAVAGVKVYDVTGATPKEIAKPCEHIYVKTVVAPTCTADGYTTHICSNCGISYNAGETVPALGHNFTQATCIKKATCSGCNIEKGDLAKHKYGVATCTQKAACTVCGLEKGELAKHVDADANNKCDNCDAMINAEDTTPAATEKSGCSGTVGAAGLVLVAALGSYAIFVEKKRK